MAGVSSESLAAALAALEAKLPTASLQLAKELFGILGTVDSSAGLRRALTDPSRSGDEKSALVKQLFGGKVSADAVEIASRTGQLPLGIGTGYRRCTRDSCRFGGHRCCREQVGRLCLRAQRTGIAGERSVLLQPGRRVQPRGTACSVRAAGQPGRQGVPRRQARTRCERGSESPDRAGRHGPRGLKVTKLVRRFAELAAKRQQRWIATVDVTRPLTETQISRLQAGLNALYGRELKINMNVDPALIGGIRIQVGDEVVDASVARPPGPAPASACRLAGQAQPNDKKPRSS